MAGGGLRVATRPGRSIRPPTSKPRAANGSAGRVLRRPSELLKESARYLVGGVNSPVRAFRQIGGEPLMLVRGEGAEVVDTEGRTFLDFIGGWGALILGHTHPAIVTALRRALSAGSLLGLTHPAEVELARLIADAVPSVEQVRFTVSGTEACMTAVRLARAHTNRTKVLTFAGCYHGHGDSLMAGKTAGIPELTAAETLTVPFNDLAAFEDAVQQRSRELACVIIEPVAANMGVVAPEPGYLARIREVTRRHGVMLVFDEVVTGFRLGWGGAQERYGITPDLTTFGKIIGGGLPIGALGGPRRIMRRLAPEGDVFHGGTFAGHPLSMAAGIATLNELKARSPYGPMERLAERLMAGLAREAERAGVPVRLNGLGSMFTLFFSSSAIHNFRQAGASRRDRFGRWASSLRRQGILIPPSPFEALFLSAVHSEEDVDRTIRAARHAFASTRGELDA